LVLPWSLVLGWFSRTCADAGFAVGVELERQQQGKEFERMAGEKFLLFAWPTHICLSQFVYKDETIVLWQENNKRKLLLSKSFSHTNFLVTFFPSDNRLPHTHTTHRDGHMRIVIVELFMHECGQQKKVQKKTRWFWGSEVLGGGIQVVRLLFGSQFDNFLRVFLSFSPLFCHKNPISRR